MVGREREHTRITGTQSKVDEIPPSSHVLVARLHHSPEPTALRATQAHVSSQQPSIHLGASSHPTPAPIPPYSGALELERFFSQFGHLIKVFMMKEHNGRSKECQFIRFDSRAATDMACATINGSMSLSGAMRALVVEYADPPEPRHDRLGSCSHLVIESPSHSTVPRFVYSMPPYSDAQHTGTQGLVPGLMQPASPTHAPMGTMMLLPNMSMPPTAAQGLPVGMTRGSMRGRYSSPTLDVMGDVIHTLVPMYMSTPQHMQMEMQQMHPWQVHHMMMDQHAFFGQEQPHSQNHFMGAHEQSFAAPAHLSPSHSTGRSMHIERGDTASQLVEAMENSSLGTTASPSDSLMPSDSDQRRYVSSLPKRMSDVDLQETGAFNLGPTNMNTSDGLVLLSAHIIMSGATLLERGAFTRDDALKEQIKTYSLSSKASLSWLSPYVISHTLVAMAVSATIYAAYHVVGNDVPALGKNLHILTGSVLGILLIARIVLGLQSVSEAAAKVQAFNKTCRNLVVLSSYVGETLTISAGAELEKKAVARFRYELVRLLNLSNFTYHLMLKGLRMTVPPAALKGGKNEAEALEESNNPTVMVVKLIASLIEQQRQAHRISNEQVSAMMGTLNAFCKFFVLFWVIQSRL